MLRSHSIETRAPSANAPNSAQLDNTPIIPPSHIRVRAAVWECGEGQTDTQTVLINIHFASAMPHVKCNNWSKLMQNELEACIASKNYSMPAQHYNHISVFMRIFICHQIWSRRSYPLLTCETILLHCSTLWHLSLVIHHDSCDSTDSELPTITCS